MKQSQFDSIKSQICQKVEMLYTILRSISNINAEALRQSKKTLLQSPYENQNERIKYAVNDIVIRIPIENAKRFSKIATGNINDIELHLSMNGLMDANVWGDKEKNPWQSLAFRAELIICTMEGEHHSKTFHVDQISELNVDYKEVHPLSHLHFSEGVEGQNVCMTEDIPRLVHYPLDIILGLSMTLQNYAPQLFGSLCKNSNYINLCYESQQRLLTPYFAQYWNSIRDGKSNNERIKTICPYLL